MAEPYVRIAIKGQILMEEKLKWSNDRIALGKLAPCDYNPRTLSAAQYEQLKESLERFNLAEVPAIDLDNVIVAGHQRVKVLLDLYGPEYEIDIRRSNRKLSKEEFDEYLVRSNKNSGSWDMDKLANNFELSDLIEWGFDSDELDLSASEVDLPDMGDGSDPDIQQVTFTLSNEQKDFLDEAMEKAKNNLDCSDSINQNKNGNILGAIMRWYIGS